MRRKQMATIRRFEEIAAWQKARELARMVYSCSDSGRFFRDYGLRDQVRRAAVSAMSNIAEGFERGGKAEFIQFLSVAKGSAGEVESQLYVALDQGYISQKQLDLALELSSSTKRLISGFMGYLRQSGLRGEKYKARPSAAVVNQKPETRN
jgi:four helix bundle protein